MGWPLLVSDRAFQVFGKSSDEACALPNFKSIEAGMPNSGEEGLLRLRQEPNVSVFIEEMNPGDMAVFDEEAAHRAPCPEKLTASFVLK